MKRIEPLPFLLIAYMIIWLLTGCQAYMAPTPQEEGIPTGQSTPLTTDLVNVMLQNTHLQVSASGLATTFPPGCTGQEPACYRAKPGKTLLGIELNPTDLPQGDMLRYKELPPEIAVRDNTGADTGISYRIYNVTTRTLTLAFEVSLSATGFSLLWPGVEPIPLQPVQQTN